MNESSIPSDILNIANKHPKIKQYFEQQAAEIKHLKSRKKYGLVWEEEKTEEYKAKDGRLPVLKEISTKRISSKTGQDNILIEGDNLHALSILNYTHSGKIDIIYIDPPYNVGREFIYNDNLVDKEDSYKHSKWLSFMSKRLRLSKKLLSKNGFIFISIDEHEMANLKLLCDEIFNEKNFRNSLAVKRYDKNINLQFIKKGLTSYNVGFEYVLIYSKNSDSKLKPLYKKTTKKRSSIGYWKGFWNNADRKTMRYNLLGIAPKHGQWKWKKDVADDAVKNYEIYVEKHSEKTLEEYWIKTGKILKFIRRNESGKGINKGVEHWIPPSDVILRNTLWYDVFASKPIKHIGVDFDNPKNPDMIKELINSAANDKSTILDFFAGSGTTGHAVLELNKQIGGNKKFILCTNNENNICTDICYPRIKKAINGYTNPKGKEVKKLGGNLIYYKIKKVEKESESEKNNPPLITDGNKRRIITKVTDMLCVKEWCFDLVYQMKSTVPKYEVYKNKDGKYIGIIYDSDSTVQFVKKINSIKEIKKIHTYVFSEIVSTALRKCNKIKFESIPVEILWIWNQIFESNICRRPMK